MHRHLPQSSRGSPTASRHALLYSGDATDSAEAFRLGLVDNVLPKATLHAEVIEIARHMSRVAMDCPK
jgi:enoyl-CoA hydratase/carnithine racemase